MADKIRKIFIFSFFWPIWRSSASIVQAVINGKTLAEVNTELGASISPKSISQWIKLYKTTREIIYEPATSYALGCLGCVKKAMILIDTEDNSFIKELVTEDPTIYLDKIKQSLLDFHFVHVCMQTTVDPLS
ncbi:hypothetical protein VP01_6944g1 [Puccinia sorghi]|uniref:Uncharacterized protein n=1 Tax=Puccinia sorghi TaxID=27349 RepID=A0A0L6UEX3_9BASI|nr:hypothetical protein VP01_6944g1 [Puccinia sorghi]